jgi:hypothetical protein
MTGVAVLTLVHTAISIVGICRAQLFAKVPALHDLAPTQTEPPFGITQLAVLAVFVVLGRRAVRRARTLPSSPRPAV